VSQNVRWRTDFAVNAAYRSGAGETSPALTEGATMLYTIAVILIILWLLGLVSSVTMGGLIHVLLVIAIIVLLVNFIGGRRSL
jgi:hypothetical protein